MNKYLLLVLLSVLVVSCKSKKVSLAGNDDGELGVPEFIDYFQPLPLPYAVTDTILRRKEPEAASINYTTFHPAAAGQPADAVLRVDTVPGSMRSERSKFPKPRPMCWSNVSVAGRRMLYIFCFDRKDHYSAARPVLYSDNSSGVWGAAANGRQIHPICSPGSERGRTARSTIRPMTMFMPMRRVQPHFDGVR